MSIDPFRVLPQELLEIVIAYCLTDWYRKYFGDYPEWYWDCSRSVELISFRLVSKLWKHRLGSMSGRLRSFCGDKIDILHDKKQHISLPPTLVELRLFAKSCISLSPNSGPFTNLKSLTILSHCDPEQFYRSLLEKGVTNLESLYIGTPHTSISRKTILLMCKANPNLRELYISNTGGIEWQTLNRKDIARIAEFCPNLEEVEISG